MASTNVRSRRPRGTGRTSVLSKLEERVEEGDYYGALQMYKTLYSRHANENNTEKAAELATSAAIALIKFKQLSAATEMAVLLIDLYVSHSVHVSDATKEPIRKINEAYMQHAIGSEQQTFLKSAIKWSATLGSRTRGDPELQLLLARAYRDAGDHAGASRHYIHTEHPREFADSLFAWSEEGYSSERDLFIARAVLQLLSLENIRDGNIVYEAYIEKLKAKGIELDTPLIHFTSFILQTVLRDAAPLFVMLRERYATCLKRDPSFATYLNYIGQKFFNIQPPQSGLSAIMNMFGGM